MADRIHGAVLLMSSPVTVLSIAGMVMVLNPSSPLRKKKRKFTFCRLTVMLGIEPLGRVW